MRILHFYKTYLPDSYGGTEQFIYQLARATAGRGHHVDVLSLTNDTSRPEIDFGNHVSYRVPLTIEIASTGFSLAMFGKFKELSAEADVVHYHFPWPSMDLVHFASGRHRPCVVTYHSDIVRQRKLMSLYRPLMSAFLGDVDRIVATSPNYLATSDVLRNYRSKTDVIPIGLDEKSYPAVSAARLQSWTEKVGQGFFLFVGALRYYKGLDILIEALKGTDATAVIAGIGPKEQELRDQARRLGVTNVKFLGLVNDEDKVCLINLSKAIVFPSHLRSEAFGVSLLEGAMYGKPMISSEIGTGTTYINVAGETGLVVPPAAPDAFRAAMQKLQAEPDECARMGRNARRRYEQLFTSEMMVEKYLSLYAEVLHGSAAHAGTACRGAVA